MVPLGKRLEIVVVVIPKGNTARATVSLVSVATTAVAALVHQIEHLTSLGQGSDDSRPDEGARRRGTAEGTFDWPAGIGVCADRGDAARAEVVDALLHLNIEDLAMVPLVQADRAGILLLFGVKG